MTYFDVCMYNVHMKQDKVTPNGASVTLVFLSSEKLEVSTAGGVSRLEISSLRDSDAGEYVCQLSLLTGLLSLHHTLDVLGSHCPYNIFTYMQFLVGFYQYSLITLIS